ILTEGSSVPVAIIGEIRDVVWFTARDEIQVVGPRMLLPNGGEVLPAGSTIQIRWEEPRDWHVDHADLTISLDAGATWETVAQGIQGSSYAWTLPGTPTTRALARVQLYDADGLMGSDMSDAAFTIQPTVSSVEAEATAAPREYALHPNAPNPFNPNVDSVRSS